MYLFSAYSPSKLSKVIQNCDINRLHATDWLVSGIIG